MKYDAIVFDIDGTLIDYDYSQYLALSGLIDYIPWKSDQIPDEKEIFEALHLEYKSPAERDI